MCLLQMEFALQNFDVICKEYFSIRWIFKEIYDNVQY